MANYMYITDLIALAERVASTMDRMGIIDSIFSSVSAPEKCPRAWNTDDLEAYLMCNQVRVKAPESISLQFFGMFFFLLLGFWMYRLVNSLTQGVRRIGHEINSNNRNTMNRLTIEGGSNFIPMADRPFRSNGGTPKFQV